MTDGVDFLLTTDPAAEVRQTVDWYVASGRLAMVEQSLGFALVAETLTSIHGSP